MGEIHLPTHPYKTLIPVACGCRLFICYPSWRTSIKVHLDSVEWNGGLQWWMELDWNSEFYDTAKQKPPLIQNTLIQCLKLLLSFIGCQLIKYLQSQDCMSQ